MASTYQTLDRLDVKGKRVLVRADLNVTLAGGKIADDTRIREAVPTVTALIGKGARQVILMSHLGDPKGAAVPALSLAPVAKRLAEVLGMPVPLVTDYLAGIKGAEGAKVILLENLRFHPGEEANDAEFAKRLAALADIYVNDAFGTAHRAHASIVGVPQHLPAAAGLLMQKELSMLAEARDSPKKPLVVVLGGAKLKTKLPVIERYLRKADHIIISGAMAYTFFAAKGLATGASLVEKDFLEKAKSLLADREFRERAVFPVDVVVARERSASSERKTVPVEEIPAGWMALDIGPRSVERFSKLFASAGMVIWNGPLGYYEIPSFAEGTRAVASALASSKGKVIAGGGDTITVIESLGVGKRYAHLSTGGGAFLDYLAGKELPALAALERARKA